MDDSHLGLNSTRLLQEDASLIFPQQKHRIADNKKGLSNNAIIPSLTEQIALLSC